MEDTSTRHIINNVVVNHHRAVKLEMVSDSVAWNFVDLKTKKKAVERIKHFKSYARATM